MSRALVLLNLGTPDAPTEEKVREYLREFLMDGRVIDVPFPFRWLMVNGAILRKRPASSAAAYAKIWTDRGSPLLFHLLDLVPAVQAELGEGWLVVPAMRYGRPSIAGALESLKGRDLEEIVVFPLYPQYSLAATQSSIEETLRLARRRAPGARIRFVPAFYDDERFLDAFSAVAARALEGFGADYALFSFHGLPERQVRRVDRSPGREHCLASGGCCDRVAEANRDCYRAQCYATARGLASRLGLAADRWSVSFQSRLGRTPWIQPYTDVMYGELARRGVRRLAVLCPAFVADCLETLEEIRMRGREQFRELGGEELLLVPSLNAAPEWARAAAGIARSFAEGAAGGGRVSPSRSGDKGGAA